MLANTLIALALILTTWAACALVILGLSAWYLRLFPKNPPTLSDFLTAFWVGLATLLGLLQFWHFFAPIDTTAYATLLILGTLGFVSLAPSLARALRITPHRPLLAALLTFTLIALWLANRATGPGAEYDSGLYHIPAVNWTRLYRIVPGLANLHMRFGFSSTITLLSAWLDHGPWTGNANHLVNCFFLAALAATIVRSLFAILISASSSQSPSPLSLSAPGSARGSDAEISTKSAISPRDPPAKPGADTENAIVLPAPHHWLLIFSSILLIDWGIDIQAASYSTDIGAVVLSVAAAYYFLKAFATPNPASSGFVCILLCSAAVTAKASTLILCAPMALIILILLWRTAPAHPLRTLAPSIIAATLLIAPWLIRQTILSGYPLFPSEFLSLPVDWKMPFAKVQWLRHIMLNFDLWNRYEDPQPYEWVNFWFQNRILPAVVIWKALIPASIALLALGVAAFRWSRLRKLRHSISGPALLLPCTLLAALLWFKSAPDPRYASQIFALMMAAALILARSTFAPTTSKLARNITLLAAALFALCPLVAGTQEAQRYTGRTLAGVWLLPPTTGLFYPTPRSAIQSLTTPTGVQVYIPLAPPGIAFEDRVWDAPLPNAPLSEIDPTEVQIPPLRLRVPGDLQQGFKRMP